MPRAKKPAVAPTSTPVDDQPALAASSSIVDENALLAQFAAAMLRDGTGAFAADDVALRNRVKDAFARARVMLEEYKNQLNGA